MANDNPNIAGLRPFNQMSYSESTEIQSQGGKASAEKRRTVRKIKDILKGVRAEYEVDPVEQLIVSMFQQILSPTSTLNEKLKVFDCLHKVSGELNAKHNPYELSNDFDEKCKNVQRILAEIKAKDELEQRQGANVQDDRIIF